ncbi:hypothetical protein [Vibrio parahaemolyticus]|uniref:hypothetical protein n=1 Tax=Vibrio parahaemolyticus TaxID=670 RepID=UPI001123C74E|nr:hypothetical protein [Vibrio parahaemolyticus]TPB41793.1 hypothetical protein DXJ78_24170 [Vibrio parahaemolyticus]
MLDHDKVTQAQLDALNPNILRYPCSYFDNGLLPLPSLDGYRYRNGQIVIRSKMDLGLATMRRRCRVAPSRFPLKFQFTGEQKEAFETWMFEELDGGVEWFYLPLLTGDTRLEIHKVQFTATPGEDSDFICTGVFPDPDDPRRRTSTWELTAEVQAFRAKLERYTARILTRDTLSGLEKAALSAEKAVNDTPSIKEGNP